MTGLNGLLIPIVGSVGCGLLPGDRLLGIDDYDVEHAQQEHAVQKIKSAGQSVCLTVQPIPELTELSVRSPDGNETYLLRIGPITLDFELTRDPWTGRSWTGGSWIP